MFFASGTGFSRTAILGLAALLSLAVLAGCGGGQAFFMPPGFTADHSSAAAPPAALTGIAVGPPDAGVVMGSKLQLTATGLYSDGSKQIISSQVAWSSSDPTVASG